MVLSNTAQEILRSQVPLIPPTSKDLTEFKNIFDFETEEYTQWYNEQTRISPPASLQYDNRASVDTGYRSMSPVLSRQQQTSSASLNDHVALKTAGMRALAIPPTTLDRSWMNASRRNTGAPPTVSNLPHPDQPLPSREEVYSIPSGMPLELWNILKEEVGVVKGWNIGSRLINRGVLLTITTAKEIESTKIVEKEQAARVMQILPWAWIGLDKKWHRKNGKRRKGRRLGKHEVFAAVTRDKPSSQTLMTRFWNIVLPKASILREENNVRKISIQKRKQRGGISARELKSLGLFIDSNP